MDSIKLEMWILSLKHVLEYFIKKGSPNNQRPNRLNRHPLNGHFAQIKVKNTKIFYLKQFKLIFLYNYLKKIQTLK